MEGVAAAEVTRRAFYNTNSGDRPKADLAFWERNLQTELIKESRWKTFRNWSRVRWFGMV